LGNNASKLKKNINMKQLLSLFLFLVPCLALAQYPSNGNQKITLGEQTTADGLIWRGVAATDTVRKPSIDTMAYMVLDTTTNIMWHYKKATSNAWLRLNLLPSDTASFNYVNTYGTQTVNGAKTFTSAVTATRFNPTANTVTGTGMFLPAANTLGFSTNGTQKMSINQNGHIGIGQLPNSDWDASFKFFEFKGNTAISPNPNLPLMIFAANYVGTSTGSKYIENNRSSRILLNAWDGIDYDFIIQTAALGTAGNAITYTDKLRLYKSGFLSIGVDLVPSEKLDVDGNARIRAVGAGAYANDLNITSDGVLTTASSDEKYKYNILPINYGLNTILQLKPVNFQWIKGEENDLGFIAQDVAEIIPEAVNTNWNSDLLFRYESLIPILTKAIQEQQALIKALEQRIINLENK
jgi:hypothetical protein